jgi:hypothetical protein
MSDYIRSTHPSYFRSGEWARILTTASDPERGDAYVVEFEDGVMDWWVADDPDAVYEFRVSSGSGAEEER